MSAEDVVSILLSENWVFIRRHGSHMIFRKNGIICPVPDHKELKQGTLKSIRRIVKFANGEKRNGDNDIHL